MSKNDPMGSVTVELSSLLERKGQPLRKWYSLDTGGAIEVIVQWRHSPTNAWKPFAAPKHADKAPNELRVGLSQGRELSVKDQNILTKGGSSDPYCKFSLTGTNVTFHSTVQSCVEIKILRRARAESSRRPPRRQCDACSMAWRCRFLSARPSQDAGVIAEK